jgi:hypothetical protein
MSKLKATTDFPVIPDGGPRKQDLINFPPFADPYISIIFVEYPLLYELFRA